MIVVVGGGAAGFFGAITAAEANPAATVTILEQSSHFLTKVARSGGGRCNVTHACYEPRLLATRYPRGERPLIGPFHRFAAQDTVEWFQKRGVPVKTEDDGRIFPRSNSSATVVNCLLEAARDANVDLQTQTNVTAIRFEDDGYVVSTSRGPMLATHVLLATGGSRVPQGARIAAAFGHQPVPPVPSLFTFNTVDPWVHELAGVACDVEVAVDETGLRQHGPLLFTHRGVSGPAVLKLSAWGARQLAELNYQFSVSINFQPGKKPTQVDELLSKRRSSEPTRKVLNSQLEGIPARLWLKLCELAGVDDEVRWTNLTRACRQDLVRQVSASKVGVTGKSLNKDEFVTCGGIPVTEIDFRTMESRLQPRLHFAGELIDLDGITGGFNFQAAWTTGWLAGRAMAGFAQ